MRLPAALLLALAGLAGCATVDARSSFLRRVPIDGQAVVLTFSQHDGLRTTSSAMMESLAEHLTARGMRVLVFFPPEISLSDHPVVDYARAQQADLILSYVLREGMSFNMALSKLDSEGTLFSLRENRVIWRTWIKYDDMMPGPGSFSRCGRKVSEKVVATLIQDGFLHH